MRISTSERTHPADWTREPKRADATPVDARHASHQPIHLAFQPQDKEIGTITHCDQTTTLQIHSRQQCRMHHS